MPVHYSNTEGYLEPVGYSHIAIPDNHRLAHLAGMAGLDRDGSMIAPGDLRKQTVATVRRVLDTLAQLGASSADIVRRTTYVVDLTPEKMAVVREVYLEMFGEACRPAATSVGVTSLAVEGMIIECECTVALPVTS